MTKVARLLLACLPLLTALASGQTTAADFERRVIEAVTLFKEGKSEEALSRFEALHKENPRSSDAQVWLGYLYLRANRAAEAVPLLEGAERQRPNDVDILNNLGNAYLATEQHEKALAKYAAIIKLSPKLFEPYYNSGTIYLKQRNWQKALESFIQAAKLKPEDAFVQNNVGVAFQALHQDLKALGFFKKAADLRPDNPTFARNAGLVMAKMQRPEALTYLERAHAASPEPVVTLALGDAYLRANRLEDALKLYESVKEAQGKNAAYWFNLGVIRARSGDDTGAEQSYRRALQINPNDLDSLNNLGLLVYRSGKYEEATTIFDKLAGLNPSSLTAKVNLGAAAAQAGNTKKAIEAWKVVLRAEPSRTEVRLDLANALYAIGDVDGAKYHYNQVLLMSANNAEALNGMGLCHLKANKLPQAEAAFRTAIDSDPKLISAYNNLALTLEKMNQRKEAIAILEKAERIAPEDEETKRNLQRMRLGG